MMKSYQPGTVRVIIPTRIRILSNPISDVENLRSRPFRSDRQRYVFARMKKHFG